MRESDAHGWMVEHRVPGKPITFVFCETEVQAENLFNSYRETGGLAHYWNLYGFGGSDARPRKS
jgi:hypothetical protein